MLINLRHVYRPHTLAEALTLLGQGPANAALAGGTELVGSSRDDLEAVVDLSGLGLAEVSPGDGALLIGAMTSLKRLVTDPLIRALANGLLSTAAGQAAPATIRAAATLGGTLAGLKGGEEIPTALLALGARVTLSRPFPMQRAQPVPADGLRRDELDLETFLAHRTQLLEGALITRITVPIIPGARSGLARVSRSPADRAILFAAAVSTEGGARVAIGGLTSHARLLPIPTTQDQIGSALADWPATGDFRGSAEYRRLVAPVLARRALAEAMGGSSA